MQFLEIFAINNQYSSMVLGKLAIYGYYPMITINFF